MPKSIRLTNRQLLFKPLLMALLSASLSVGVSCSFAVQFSPTKNTALPQVPAPDPLLQGWNNPPASAKPHCYWYWYNNIITKDGITRDLELMAKNGIGGAYIGNIGGPGIDPPYNGRVKGYSDEWYGMLMHAVREGKRLGIEIGVFNGSGWSQSGGPWVKPEDSMQFIDCTEVKITGGTRINQVLPRVPEAVREVRVLAFPTPANDGELLRAAKLTSPQGEEWAALIDGGYHQFPANKNYGNVSLTWEFEAPQTLRSLLFRHHDGSKVSGRVLYSTDGINFTPLRTFTLDRRDGPQVNLKSRPGAVSTPPTTARFFRVEMPWDTRRDGADLGIRLSSAARIENAEEKQLGIAGQDNNPVWDQFRWPSTPEPGAGTVAPQSVIDITAKMDASGRLQWNAPAGEWIVQRYSTVSTGAKSGPTAADTEGLEIDKMSKEVAKMHIDNGVVGNLYRRLKTEDRSALKYAIADSYEQGFQNWTVNMVPEFKAHYGYDPIPWMPVLAGRVVGSADQSDRFLWDVRRLVGDLIATNYAGGLRDALHPMGLKMWLENYGHWGFPGDFSVYGGQTDELGGEYWNPGGLGNNEVRLAASTGHMYGKNLIWAESFTASGNPEESPAYLKARGDWAFAQGINRYVLHVFAHQPTNVPGFGLEQPWGTYFNHSLWFDEQGKAWTDYVRRSSFLLQQGTPAADVAYYIGEDSPVMAGRQDPTLPAGYDYDWINAEVLLKRATIKNGRLVLQGGASYAVLAIPATASMRPPVLRKITELVKQGLTVVGTPPTKSPSLQGFPRADAEVKTLVAALWPASGQANRKVGRGTVWNATPLAPVLAAKKALPVVTDLSENFLWKQRHLVDGELFFLSNQSESPLKVAPRFAVTGMAPQSWNAETGKIENLALFRTANGYTKVPLTLGPLDSVFVIFRKQSSPAIADVMRNSQSVVDFSDAGATKPSSGEVADSSLTQSFWVKPEGTINLPTPRNGGGAVELSNQRWALFPPQGNLARGEGFAGSGVSVGTNGVVIVQHWAYNAPAVLVWQSPQPLNDWTHLAINYREGVPHLFVGGKEVAQGLKSNQRLVAGVSGEGGLMVQGSPYVDEIRGLKTTYNATTDADIAALAADTNNRAPVPPPLVVDVARRGGDQIEVTANQGGDYILKSTDGRSVVAKVAPPLATLSLDGPWSVSFDGAASPKNGVWPQLSSLSDSSDEQTKYFSGNSIYEKNFELPTTFKPGTPTTLDLGQVGMIARVAINGQAAGTALRAPYRLEIGKYLKPGTNSVNVVVTNTWMNRMIGDEQFPEDVPRDGGGNVINWPEWAFTGGPRPEPRRVTLSSRHFVNKDTALRPSGLIGPVKLKFQSSVIVPLPNSAAPVPTESR